MLQILTENSVTIDNYVIKCCVIKLSRDFLILITDQNDYGIGNVIMSTPPVNEQINPISTLSPLFGLKQSILDKMVAELAALKLKRPCLSLVNVKGLERKDELVAKTVLECLKEALENTLRKIN